MAPKAAPITMMASSRLRGLVLQAFQMLSNTTVVDVSFREVWRVPSKKAKKYTAKTWFKNGIYSFMV